MELIKDYIYPATLETIDKDGNNIKLNLNKFKVTKIDDVTTVKQKYIKMYETLIDDNTNLLKTTIYDNNQIDYESPSSDVENHVDTILQKEIASILIDVINFNIVDEVDELTEMLDEIEKQLSITFNRDNIDELYVQLKGVIENEEN